MSSSTFPAPLSTHVCIPGACAHHITTAHHGTNADKQHKEGASRHGQYAGHLICAEDGRRCQSWEEVDGMPHSRLPCSSSPQNAPSSPQ